MNENPWSRLPDKPPFVLPEDRDKVLAFNFKECLRGNQSHVLNLDLIPEPFVGRPDAPLVLLGNNPGVSNQETACYRRESAYANEMRNNLLHRPANFPCLF